MLGSIALKTEDLPPGFNVTTDAITNNEEAAAVDPEGPTTTKPRLDGWQRLLGEDTTYTYNDPVGAFTNGGLATIQSSISIFADEKGASASLVWGRDMLSDPARAGARMPGVSQMAGGPISFATVGDESMAYEFTGKFHDQQYNIDVPFTADTVVVRHGRGVAYIIVSAIGGAKPGPQVEQIIRLLDQRLGQALS